MKALKVIGVVSIVSLLVTGFVFFIFFGLEHKLAWIFQGMIMLLTASVFVCFGIVIGKLGIDKFRSKRMEFINSWKSESKKWDRLAIKLRIGKFTLFDLFVKLKPFTAGVILFNYGLKTKNNPK